MLEAVQESTHRKMFKQTIIMISTSYNLYSLAQLLLSPVISAFYLEVSMDIREGRSELKGMSRVSLFTLVTNQRISNCLIGAKPCGFSLHYQGIHLCVSELIGKGCLVQRLEQREQLYPEKEGIHCFLPIFGKMETELLLPRKKALEFKVYHRDHLTHSAIFLGKIIERRRRERGNNLKGLLSKAIKQYSDHVKDPSTIFLLEQ